MAVAEDAVKGLEVKEGLDEKTTKERAIKLCEDGFRLWNEKNYKEAFERYEEAARLTIGDGNAEYNLGYAHELGYAYKDGKRIQNEEAKKLYEKAAEKGHLVAPFRLGVLYEELGGKKDLEQAIFWYEQAARRGHIEAQYRLEIILCNLGNSCLKQGDRDGARNRFLKVKEINEVNTVALRALGYICWNSLKEQKSEKDEEENEKLKKEGYEYYTKAAELGSPDAEYNVGHAHEYGKGTVQDLRRAVVYYEKAAKQGYGHALDSLDRLKKSDDPGVREAANKAVESVWSEIAGQEPEGKATVKAPRETLQKELEKHVPKGRELGEGRELEEQRNRILAMESNLKQIQQKIYELLSQEGKAKEEINNILKGPNNKRKYYFEFQIQFSGVLSACKSIAGGMVKSDEVTYAGVVGKALGIIGKHAPFGSGLFLEILASIGGRIDEKIKKDHAERGAHFIITMSEVEKTGEELARTLLRLDKCGITFNEKTAKEHCKMLITAIFKKRIRAKDDYAKSEEFMEDALRVIFPDRESLLFSQALKQQQPPLPSSDLVTRARFL